MFIWRPLNFHLETYYFSFGDLPCKFHLETLILIWRQSERVAISNLLATKPWSFDHETQKSQWCNRCPLSSGRLPQIY